MPDAFADSFMTKPYWREWPIGDGGDASINQWRGQQTYEKNRYENAHYRWPHQWPHSAFSK